MSEKLIVDKPGKGLIPAYRHIQDVQHLVYLEGHSNYTLVYLLDALNPLLVSKTLKYFEEQLPDFIRLSKTFLINPLFVKSVIKKRPRSLDIELSTGLTISASRRRVANALLELEKAR